MPSTSDEFFILRSVRDTMPTHRAPSRALLRPAATHLPRHLLLVLRHVSIDLNPDTRPHHVTYHPLHATPRGAVPYPLTLLVVLYRHIVALAIVLGQPTPSRSYLGLRLAATSSTSNVLASCWRSPATVTQLSRRTRSSQYARMSRQSNRHTIVVARWANTKSPFSAVSVRASTLASRTRTMTSRPSL